MTLTLKQDTARMCDPISIGVASLAVATVGTGVSILQGESAQKMQKRANQQAQKQAADQKAANQRAINAANQKTPDMAAIYSANRTPGGAGATMLTGSGGAPVGGSLLGKQTLLGV